MPKEEERRYSSYSFLTSTLNVGEWTASRHGRSIAPEKDLRCRLYRRLGGPRAGLDTENRRKILFAFARDQTPIIQ